MNKNVKNFFSVIICAVMILSVFAVSVSAEGEKTKFKLHRSGEVVVGEQIDIYISVENAVNLSMGDIELTYDPSAFEYVNIVSADKNNAMFVGNKLQNGNVAFSFIRYESVSGNYDIAVLSLIPLAEDTEISLHAISFTADNTVDDADFLLSEAEIRTVEPVKPETLLEYKIVDDHAVVSGCDRKVTDKVEIPAEYEGYPVTEIADNAFAHCGQIRSVVIPEGVTKIGYSAFMLCSRLREVQLPETLETIDSSAFYMCSSLDNVIIPDGVTVIEEHTFYECSNLKNITLSENLRSIGRSAFAKCGMKTIDIPDSVTSIGGGAFAASALESIVIPEGVTLISNDTFNKCKELVDVTIPDSVVAIYSEAFYGCVSMTSITIPASVTEIGYMAVGYGENSFQLSPFKIYGAYGSEAHRYAYSNRLGFASADGTPLYYDVNNDGNITAADARLALRAAAKIIEIVGENFIAADINSDGKITASDARLILRKAAKLD